MRRDRRFASDRIGSDRFDRSIHPSIDGEEEKPIAPTDCSLCNGFCVNRAQQRPSPGLKPCLFTTATAISLREKKRREILADISFLYSFCVCCLMTGLQEAMFDLLNHCMDGPHSRADAVNEGQRGCLRNWKVSFLPFAGQTLVGRSLAQGGQWTSPPAT